MILIKTPLRRRIEKKRYELLMQRVDLKLERVSRTLTPAEYSKVAVRDGDLRDMIRLLDELLQAR